MNTQILNVHKDSKLCIEEASKQLLEGKIIIFPTDTVYGIGCLFDELFAVERIYELKGRDFSKPLAAYFSDISMMFDYIANPTYNLKKIATHFMPGAITLVAKKNNKIANIITSNFDTIGLRIPDNNFLLELINNIGKPIVGTSANLSNFPSAKTADEAYEYFNGTVPLIINDDKSILGIESTVFSIIDDKFTLIREGAIPSSKIMKIMEEER